MSFNAIHENKILAKISIFTVHFLFSGGQLWNVQGSQLVEIFTCAVCAKGFKLKHNLKQHMSIHTGDRPYACQFCQKKFRRKHHLERHAFTKHGRRVFEEQSVTENV